MPDFNALPKLFSQYVSGVHPSGHQVQVSDVRQQLQGSILPQQTSSVLRDTQSAEDDAAIWLGAVGVLLCYSDVACRAKTRMTHLHAHLSGPPPNLDSSNVKALRMALAQRSAMPIRQPAERSSIIAGHVAL